MRLGVTCARLAALAMLGVLVACGGLPSGTATQTAPAPPPDAAAPGGEVKAALILPLGGGGNAAEAAQAMRNAAELSLAELAGAKVQLVVKDDGGTAEGAVKILRKIGANVVAACFVIDLPDLGGAEKIRALDVPVRTLIAFAGH